MNETQLAPPGAGLPFPENLIARIMLATLSTVRNFKTRARFPHPWFGPMDAHGWHALAGGHMSIHRVQIERILAGSGQ